MIDVGYLTAVSVLPISAMIVGVVVYFMARADRSHDQSRRANRP